MKTNVKIFIILLLTLGVVITYQIKHIKIHYSQKNIAKQILSFDHSIKRPVAFDSKGLNNIALIMMIKDEDDIIYENLVWHFCLGFRKFLIIDNNSTDQTRSLIEKFKKETQDHDIVIIIDDPIIEFIQGQMITGAYSLVGSIWNDLEWVFPVDADEFWLSETKLETILANIPRDVEIIETIASQYLPSDDYHNLLTESFYKKLHYKIKTFGKKKIALRARLPELSIAQGNHRADFSYRKKWWRKLTFTDRPSYINGNLLGLHMREFFMRSPKQVHKKLFNGMTGNLAAKEKRLLPSDSGNHWDSYKQDLENYGLTAALKRFNAAMISSSDALDDPLPINQSLELFNQIIGGKRP